MQRSSFAKKFNTVRLWSIARMLSVSFLKLMESPPKCRGWIALSDLSRRNAPLEPLIMLTIRRDLPVSQLDEEVRRVFNYAVTMLKSLASGANVILFGRFTMNT